MLLVSPGGMDNSVRLWDLARVMEEQDLETDSNVPSSLTVWVQCVCHSACVHHSLLICRGVWNNALTHHSLLICRGVWNNALTHHSLLICVGVFGTMH